MRPVADWPDAFRAQYGGAWPEDYTCIDVETTGFDADVDVIWQFGWVIVEKRRAVDRGTLTLNWFGFGAARDACLRQRIAACSERMRAAGRATALSEAVVRRGVPAAEGFGLVRDFLEAVRRGGRVLAAHNGYGFDEKRLATDLAHFGLDEDFTFGPSCLIDTNAIERALGLLDVDPTRLRVWSADTLRSWSLRQLAARRKGLRSNLEEHCFEKYGFAARGLRREDMHDAESDAFAVHLLMESYRELETQRSALPAAPPPPLPSPPSTPVRPAPAAFHAAPASRRRRGQRIN